MSNLDLTILFNNVERPPLLQYKSVTDIPLSDLEPDKLSQLSNSLIVERSNGHVCAASARIWESLLDGQNRLPYLLLRVADMRFALGSKITALLLYKELQSLLLDSDLDHWIARSWSAIQEDTQLGLLSYKHGLSLGFSPRQRWRSTANDPFPQCTVNQDEIQNMLKEWKEMGTGRNIMAFALNLHCLETNVLEKTFQFDIDSSNDLFYYGFFNKALPLDRINHPIRGVVQNCADAISILQDTHKAMSDAFNSLQFGPTNLTVGKICRLHATLMRTSRVLYCNTPAGYQLCYTNAGITRQISQVNVTAASTIRGELVRVQFCPWDKVDAELRIFCTRFNELIVQTDVDPFASAAWISHMFVSIHPFEDGNGRLSRILSSIPLIRNGLPPLCIPASIYKPRYIASLNSIRANEGEDYRELMDVLYAGTDSSMFWLKSMTHYLTAPGEPSRLVL
ncbi:hypothetical protein HYPSUDRAFT_193694 [Hypholoma sublateritium FD-334 SS-4]|uniref:Fido domain-containing protein n=1 Tax=Hypholoma sublateritium (strain FD-334 SS-4) TaxID=945553 RepID=A0A0D2NHE2_HYPSF|nr:hypothetical protein HYPSUDRAFT_193694 [Hypholoma sublateritium FD-334 SS-4]